MPATLHHRPDHRTVSVLDREGETIAAVRGAKSREEALDLLDTMVSTFAHPADAAHRTADTEQDRLDALDMIAEARRAYDRRRRPAEHWRAYRARKRERNG